MLCIQRLWSPDRTSPSKNVIRSCFINIKIQSTKKITRILAQVALSLYLPFSHSGVDMRGELSTLAPLHTPPTPPPPNNRHHHCCSHYAGVLCCTALCFAFPRSPQTGGSVFWALCASEISTRKSGKLSLLLFLNHGSSSSASG